LYLNIVFWKTVHYFYNELVYSSLYHLVYFSLSVASSVAWC
jgi:hypothetical protein